MLTLSSLYPNLNYMNYVTSTTNVLLRHMSLTSLGTPNLHSSLIVITDIRMSADMDRERHSGCAAVRDARQMKKR